jgi:hypothetical protein
MTNQSIIEALERIEARQDEIMAILRSCHPWLFVPKPDYNPEDDGVSVP